VGSTLMRKTNIQPMDYRLNKTQDVQTLYHSDGSTTYTTDYLSHNTLGTPLKTHGYSGANHRYTTNTVTNHVSGDYYVLALPTSTSISDTDSNYTQVNSTTYTSTSQAHYDYSFGQWQKQYSYLGDGNVSKIEFNVTTDQGQYRYQQFGNYKRGQPQTIKTPISVGGNSQPVYLTVNENGWVTQTTDFNNNTTKYVYDNMGRLNTVDPVDASWANTSISFGLVAGAEETGVSTGMFKQVITKANLQQTNYLDALLRPVLTKTTDTSTNISVYQKTKFNAYNKATYTAYPSNTVAADEIEGSTTKFDGMQRKQDITQYGVSGSTSYAYLKNNKRSVTNNLNYATTTTFLAYGQPCYDSASYIQAPEGVNTTIAYDKFGNTTNISQGGLSEYRYYDTNQRLCQTYRADTGKTVYDYNTAGELTWYAQGASGATAGCARADVPASQRVNMTYTNLGYPKTKNFADGNTPDISYAYDKNGNATNVNSGTTNWTYAYNSQNQLTNETLTLDNHIFALAYGYNTLGSVTNMTSPSGRTVDYATNAFGQPTKAGNYAVGANYHANGTLTAFTYGNGMTHSKDLKDRLLPEWVKMSDGATAKMHLAYAYDDNGNIESITDYTNRSYDVSMDYDGMDRLKVAKGKWGASTSFTYDTMGNITSKNLGSMAVSYNYDAGTKRLMSANVTGSKAKNYNFTYDSKGAVINNGNVALPRNQAGQVTSAAGHSFIYDGNGKRIKDTKTADNKPRYSIYDKSGKMVYQWDQRTETITDFIFLGGESVAEAQVSLGNGSQSVNNTNVGYTGHQWDDASGLNYMQARYYDPVIGRFMSNDPVGFTNIHNFNRYAYANNNPYKFTDPDGRFACGELCIIAVGVVAGLVFDEAIEVIRGEDNSAGNATIGGSIAATGKFEKKPRGGIAGGGPSKNKTSVASKANHAAAKKGVISKKASHAVTKVLRKVPYMGAAIAVAQVVDAISDRIETDNDTDTQEQAENKEEE
jgi:RHS repeat-associated protein